MKKIITKIGISIFSLFFFLVLLEGGLRIAAYFYFNKLVPSANIHDDARRSFKILSIGDSYTVGGAGMWKNSYPVQLQEMLSSRYNENFSVINGGICENNSTQAWEQLSDLIITNRPDYVILLVGAANGFNFTGYEEGVRSIISDLRIYKMFRILKTNLKGELLKWRLRHRFTADSPHWDTRFFPFTKSYVRKGRLEEAEKIYKKAIESAPDQYQAYIELGELYQRMERLEEAEEMFEKALALNPDQKAHFALARCYLRQKRWKEAEEKYKKAVDMNPTFEAYCRWGEVYLAQGKYDTAFEVICRGLELGPGPGKPEPGAFCYFNSFFLAGMAYELQSKYDADYFLKALERASEKSPGLKWEKEFTGYVSFLKSKGAWEQNRDGWLRRDLEKIVKLCRRNNIKLMIQNYPYPFALANKALRDVALRHSLPFVDNLSVFDDLVARYGRAKYFVDDNHCTIEGHKIMAQNVYKAFISEWIISE